MIQFQGPLFHHLGYQNVLKLCTGGVIACPEKREIGHFFKSSLLGLYKTPLSVHHVLKCRFLFEPLRVQLYPEYRDRRGCVQMVELLREWAGMESFTQDEKELIMVPNQYAILTFPLSTN